MLKINPNLGYTGGSHALSTMRQPQSLESGNLVIVKFATVQRTVFSLSFSSADKGQLTSIF